MGDWYAGLDLGQAGDFTALAIVERIEVPPSEPVRIERIARVPRLPEWAVRAEVPQPPLPTVYEERVVQAEPTVEYHVRHLERPELGTPYPQIVAHVLAMLEAPELRGQPVTLVIDRTGVGRAVYDLFTQAGYSRGTRAALIPITITAGDTETRETDGSGGWRVPKRDLVGVLQVLLQGSRLRIADGLPLGPTLAAEMLNFKAKITERGHDAYEAGAGGPASASGDWREGAHDDLVLAATLACWYAERRPGRVTYYPLPW